LLPFGYDVVGRPAGLNTQRAGAITIESLWRAVGKMCDLFHPQECWNFFKAAGYGADQTPSSIIGSKPIAG
jgi:hypothetical protein